MKASIKDRFGHIDTYTYDEIQEGLGPPVVTCTDNGGHLQAVPQGVEVFGPTVSAVRDKEGTLYEITEDDMILQSEHGEIVVLSVALFNKLYV